MSPDLRLVRQGWRFHYRSCCKEARSLHGAGHSASSGILARLPGGNVTWQDEVRTGRRPRPRPAGSMICARVSARRGRGRCCRSGGAGEAYGCRSEQPDDLASTHDRRAMRVSKEFGNLPSGCRGTDLGRYSPAPTSRSRNLRAPAATTRSDGRLSRRSQRQVDPFGHRLALHITMTSAA